MKPGTPNASLLQRSHRPQVAPALDIIVDSPLWKAQRGVKAVLQRAKQSNRTLTESEVAQIVRELRSEARS